MKITTKTTRDTVEALTVSELKAIVKDNGLELEGECRKWSLVNAVWGWVEPQVVELILAKQEAADANEARVAAWLTSPEWVAKKATMVKEIEGQIKSSQMQVNKLTEDLTKYGVEYALRWHGDKAAYHDCVIRAGQQWIQVLDNLSLDKAQMLDVMRHEQTNCADAVMRNLDDPKGSRVLECKASYYLLAGMIACIARDWNEGDMPYCFFNL